MLHSLAHYNLLAVLLGKGPSVNPSPAVNDEISHLVNLFNRIMFVCAKAFDPENLTLLIPILPNISATSRREWSSEGVLAEREGNLIASGKDSV